MAMVGRLVRQRQGMNAARYVGGLVEGFRDSGSPASTRVPVAQPQPLTGQIAWVIGGAGVIGRGICRGLLQAGATVIVNSGSQSRLDRLYQDLGCPQKLIGIQGSMRPAGADAVVKDVMEMTNSCLNHVVAHSGVRWWASSQRGGSLELENELGMGKPTSDLFLDRTEFLERASLLPALHYTAAQLLLPHLENSPGSSYTFVTGGVGQQRSIEAQVNAHGVWGLAAALREQYASSPVRVAEVRVNLRIDRPAHERALDPRERPLSADLGEVCAGLASSPSGEASGLHSLGTMEHVETLKGLFPCPIVMKGLPMLWHWEKSA